MENVPVSVSEAIAVLNQTLEYAYPTLVVEGEVASFKVNQNKFVFFDIKDAEGTLNCFMMVYSLRVPIEDGMKVRVIARPTITKWGRFSLTVREVIPAGEGSIKRAFGLLKTKLEKEGLFDVERKRPLPYPPKRIGVVSSTGAAGYGDFIKILGERWGGLEIVVAHTQVQGQEAPRQIIEALKTLNELSDPVDVIAVVRGGGSADDLAVFNDEPLLRAVAASRAPVISGVGHEVDETLIDLVADVRASTPSNAAERLVPDRVAVSEQVSGQLKFIISHMQQSLARFSRQTDETLDQMSYRLVARYDELQAKYQQISRLLDEFNPKRALQRGYSLLRNQAGVVVTTAAVGDTILIETKQANMSTKVIDVKDRSND